MIPAARRLDAALAAQTGCTRSQARGLILAGRVRVDGRPATKPGANVRETVAIDVVARPRYVSRGGEKLEHALRAFAIDADGVIALDVGASTGGFTDCLLQHGGSAVFAVDVGYGQLAWQLRQDPRVHVLERTNFRHLANDAFAQQFDLIAVDVSFISAGTIAARAKNFLRPEGHLVILVKPQFEAGPERVGSGGVVREAGTHLAVLRELRSALERSGLATVNVTVSPLRGPAGNSEFFFACRHSGAIVDDAALERVVLEAHRDA